MAVLTIIIGTGERHASLNLMYSLAGACSHERFEVTVGYLWGNLCVCVELIFSSVPIATENGISYLIFKIVINSLVHEIFEFLRRANFQVKDI